MNKNPPSGVSSQSGKFMLMFAAVTLLSACAPSAGTLAKGDKNNPVVLAMTWETRDTCKIATITPDANICQSTHGEFCMPRSKWVEWQSTPAKNFYVYFSPFTKGSFESGTDGIAKGKIDVDAPYAIYKYTIVADGCDPDTQANDPAIRVDK